MYKSENSAMKEQWQNAAVSLFESAVKERTITHDFEMTTLLVKDLYYSRGVLAASATSFAVLFMLPLFEPPNPTYSVPNVWLGTIEVWCYALLMFRASLKTRLLLSSKRKLWYYTSHIFHWAFLLVLTIDAIVSNAGWNSQDWNKNRIVRCLRVILLFEYSGAMKRWFASVIRTISRSIATWLFLAFHILFFSILGVMLFYGSDEGKLHFNTFDEAIVTLIVLLSTCNSPSVLMPGYVEEPVKTLYFVVFILLGTILALNFVLAAVYHEHKSSLAKDGQYRWLRHQAAISGAYRYLLLSFYYSKVHNDATEWPELSHAVSQDFIDFLRQSRGESSKRDSLGARSVEYHPPLPHSYVVDLLLGLDLRGLQVKKLLSEEHVLMSSQQGRIQGEAYSGLSYQSFCTLVHRLQLRDATQQKPKPSEALGVRSDDATLAPSASTPLLESVTVLPLADGDTPQVQTSGLSSLDQEATNLVEIVRMKSFLEDNSAHSCCTRWCSWIVHVDFAVPNFQSSCLRGQSTTRLTPARRFNILNVIVNTLLVFNVSTTVFALVTDIDHYMQGDEPSGMFVVNYLSTWIFMLEMLARVVDSGPGEFVQHNWNVFEFSVVLVAFVGGTAAVLVPVIVHETPAELEGVTRAFMFIRQVRLLRLLHNVPAFRFLLSSIASLGPILKIFAGIIWVMFYNAAIIGMVLFSSFQLEDYNGNDFSSFGASLMTLLELLIVNDWNKTMEGFVQATGTKVSQLFFITWYFFGVLVLLNCITTFVVSAFDHSMNEDGKAEEESLIDAEPSLGPVSANPLLWSELNSEKDPPRVRDTTSQISSQLLTVAPWPVEVERALEDLGHEDLAIKRNGAG